MSRFCNYVVVTPARNEQGNIPHTIRSMVAQTHRPLRWVIVDDGSTDETGQMIDAAAQEHAWISALHRADRGARKQGGGVVETFYEGFALVEQEQWEFLVKLDADLSFEPDYFERSLHKFAEESKLGIGGGMICHQEGERLICESPGDPAFHVRGATKIYRRECWEALGGLIRAPGWDTIDELKANMLEWTTRTFKDIPLRHHRITGFADGTWKNQIKFGLSNYITGYHPLFMFVKCAKRVFQKPILIGSAGLLWGFLSACLRGEKQNADPELIRYVRRQQMNKLTFRPSLWSRTLS